MHSKSAIWTKLYAKQPCTQLRPDYRESGFAPIKVPLQSKLKRQPDQDLAKALPSANTEFGAFTRIGLTTGAVEIARRTTGLSSI